MKFIAIILCFSAYAHAQTSISADSIVGISDPTAQIGLNGGISIQGESVLLSSGEDGGFLLQTPSGSYNDIDLNPDFNLFVAPGQAGSNVILGKPLQLSPGNSQPSCDSSSQGVLYYVAGASGVADALQICMKAADDSFSWHSVP